MVMMKPLLLLVRLVLLLQSLAWSDDVAPPTLNGAHFKVTVAETASYMARHFVDGKPVYTGYCVDIWEALAKRANFSYEFRTPTGLGANCHSKTNASLYADEYFRQFNCAENDVYDPAVGNLTTDFFLSVFYVIPRRLAKARFTLPYSPPTIGTNIMMGTATGLRSIEEFVELQKRGKMGPACAVRTHANHEFVSAAFPDIQFDFSPASLDEFADAFRNGTEVCITDYPSAVAQVANFHSLGQCNARGKPIGLIGNPLKFGPSQFSIGVRKELPIEVLDTLNYWINYLMTCQPESECTEDSFSKLHEKHAGTGDECGYRQFPALADEGLGAGTITGIVVGCVIATAGLMAGLYQYRLVRQRHRIKKRFVMQIARNISIGPSPGSIAPQKLADQVQHIGGPNGLITKQALSDWLNDVKLQFLSKRDFEVLWSAMDISGDGFVDPVEFFVFLSSCGPEFEEVYAKLEKLPKLERLKIAARRLTNLAELGEEGVRSLEHKYDRSNNGDTSRKSFSARDTSNSGGRRRSTIIADASLSHRSDP